MHRRLHPDTLQQRHDQVDKPLVQFSGQVALEQLDDYLDFVNRQRVGSYFYEVKPWPEVLKHPRVTSVNFDQYQLGQRNSKGGHVKNRLS